MSFVTQEQFFRALKDLYKKVDILSISTVPHEQYKKDMETILATMREDTKKNTEVIRQFIKEQNTLMGITQAETLEDRLKRHREEAQVDLQNRLKETAKDINEETQRYIGSISEDFQDKVRIVGEGVQTTWEKCVRDYEGLNKADILISERIEKVENALVMYDDPVLAKKRKVIARMKRKHTGRGQDKRKG